MSRYYIILNPISGRGSGLQHKQQIEQFCTENKLDFSLVVTERPGHALELAKAAVKAGVEVIVSAGGDGTANEVINGILLGNKEYKLDAAMAVIPVGRGNDFAFSMGIPVDFLAACQLLLTPENPHRVDIGSIVGGNFPTGRFFGNGVGIGFDAVVGFEAVKLKYLTGMPSYLVAALKTIFLYFKAPHLRVELDDKTIDGRYLMVSIMNGIRMGGGFFMAPAGNPSDGHFDLCVVGGMGKLATFPMIMKFMKGTQPGDPRVQMLSSKTIHVTSLTGGIPCHADGETVCENGQKVDISILPAALRLLA
jgi:YegS/Rv2252/BmrU family lipid kinase